MNVVEILTELVTADTEVLRLKKCLNELPEAAQIMECRAKRKEIKGKQDQVIELNDDTEAKLAKLQLEEERIIEKIKSLQETIDHTSDYRVTQSATRDMEGLIKRQGSLGGEQDELLERQIKIDNMAAQLADMLHNLDHKEAHLTSDFKEKGGEIKAQQDKLYATINELLAQLESADAMLARRYKKLRDEKGGIAVAFLQGDTCSVCRTQLLTGQLAHVKEAGSVTECPNCHRIFVVGQ